MTTDALIIKGDCLNVMAGLPDGSIHCCVTSPPYWGLRDYGVDGQIGLESTPEAYVARMVEVFREVRRVLRDDGTCWLNLGDSYAGSVALTTNEKALKGKQGRSRGTHGTLVKRDWSTLKPKDLVGIPWRVAFALQADGWWLRQDIIWHKPNPMPESVRDRCTKAHEYVFLLTKSERYYYDAEAVSEAASTKPHAPGWAKTGAASGRNDRNDGNEAITRTCGADGTRNRRSVWTVTTKPFRGAHFAVMPEALVEPCVLAGSRGPGRRCDCDEVIGTPTGSGLVFDPSLTTGRAGMNRERREDEGRRLITRREQRGHAEQLKASPHRAEMEAEAGPSFAHYIRTDRSGARPLPPALLEAWTGRGWIVPVPPCDCPDEPGDTVLDPFAGSGTVGAVAIKHGRNFIGSELNPAYVQLARERIDHERNKTPLFSNVI